MSNYLTWTQLKIESILPELEGFFWWILDKWISPFNQNSKVQMARLSSVQSVHMGLHDGPTHTHLSAWLHGIYVHQSGKRLLTPATRPYILSS